MYQVMTSVERTEALARGLMNLVALLEPLTSDRVDYIDHNRPLVNATSDELEIAVTMCGDAEDEDPANAEHWVKYADFLHARWQHLQEGGVVGAATDEEVIAEMHKFDTWLSASDPEVNAIHDEIEMTIDRIASEMGISHQAAVMAYNTGEAW